MKITLVRHAEVIKEYQGKYNGHIDIPLSKKGREDAVKLATKLQNEYFDKIYCSDLLRAKQTLDAFSYDIEPIFTDKLREKSWGRHEGKSFEEILADGIEYIDFEQWISSLDGEDIDSYKKRIKNYFYEDIFKQKSENILIVTHAGVIKTLINIVDDMTFEDAFGLTLPYTSYAILETSTMSFIYS